MPLTVFSPSIDPSPGSAHAVEVKLNQMELGDGYSLAQPNGLNHVRRTLTLQWSGLTTDQRNELASFFMGQGGYKPFLYTPFGDTAPTRWICKEWSSSSAAPWTFQAMLKEDFSLQA